MTLQVKRVKRLKRIIDQMNANIKTKTMKLQDLKENDLIQVRREQYNELGNINL